MPLDFQISLILSCFLSKGSSYQLFSERFIEIVSGYVVHFANRLRNYASQFLILTKCWRIPSE